MYSKLNPQHLITVHWCICPSLVCPDREPPSFCGSPLGRAVLEDRVSHCYESRCYLSCTAVCRAAGSHLSCGVCYRVADNPESAHALFHLQPTSKVLPSVMNRDFCFCCGGKGTAMAKESAVQRCALPKLPCNALFISLTLPDRRQIYSCCCLTVVENTNPRISQIRSSQRCY